MLNTSSCDVGAFWFTRPLEWGKLHGYPLYQAISMMSGPTIFHTLPALNTTVPTLLVGLTPAGS